MCPYPQISFTMVIHPKKTWIFTQEWGLAAPPHVQDGCSVMWQPAAQWSTLQAVVEKNWKVWKLQETGPVQPSQNDEALNSQYLRVGLPNTTCWAILKCLRIVIVSCEVQFWSSFVFLDLSSFQKTFYFARQMLMSLQDRDVPEQFIVDIMFSNPQRFFWFLNVRICSPRRSPVSLQRWWSNLTFFVQTISATNLSPLTSIVEQRIDPKSRFVALFEGIMGWKNP